MATQNEKILSHLRCGPITSLEAQKLYGVMRLSARIKDLKDAGHNIISLPLDVPTRDGHTRVAQYSLIQRRAA